MEHLDAVIEGIHNVDLIVVIDLQSGRQLKIAESGSAPAEVIQELTFAIKDLDHAPQAIDHVEMAFRVEADALRTKHRSRGVSQLADGIVKAARTIERLHTKIHGIDN